MYYNMGKYMIKDAKVYGIRWLIPSDNFDLELYKKIYVYTNNEINPLTSEEKHVVYNEFKLIENNDLDSISFSIYTQCYNTLDTNNNNKVYNDWYPIGYDELNAFLLEN